MLSVTKHKDETWRDCVIRYADKYGLKVEALTIYDSAIKKGVKEETAAWDALYEWDLMDYSSEET